MAKTAVHRTTDMRYPDKLITAQQRSASWLCVGLDPDPQRIPRGQAIDGFCIDVIEQTADLVCAFKPNLAFFLAYGAAGIAALERVISAAPGDVPVVLDGKFGDIGSTQRMYAQAAWHTWNVDAVTVNPYVGLEAVEPFLEGGPGRGVYVLGRTSNPGAEAVQQGLYLPIARLIAGLGQADHAAVGLVVGATTPQELNQVRQAAPNLPFLIPGVGAQGGSLEAAVRWGAAGPVGPLINASRAVLYASEGPRQAALHLRDSINSLRAAYNTG